MWSEKLMQIRTTRLANTINDLEFTMKSRCSIRHRCLPVFYQQGVYCGRGLNTLNIKFRLTRMLVGIVPYVLRTRSGITNDGEGAGSAIDRAISAMPDDFVIKPFLMAHRAEVKGMLLTEYNEAEAMRLFEKDGDRKRALKDIRSLMETLKLTAKQAMDALQIPLSEQKKYDALL